MSELSARSKALLGRVASLDGPSSADQLRVGALVEAAVSSSAVAATATVGAGKLMAAFALSIAVGGGVTAAGTSVWRRAAAPPTAPRLMVSPKTEAAPRAAVASSV